MSNAVTQQSKIDHFKAVTNINNDDIAQIALQKCNWDVNVCITRYFDNPDALLSNDANQSNNNNQQHRPQQQPQRGQPQQQQPQHQQQSSIQYYASYIPGLTTFGSLISSMFGYITPYLPYFSSILSMFGSASSSIPYSQILNEFKTKHTKFGNEYNDNTIFRNIRFGQLMNENQDNDKCIFIFFNDSSSTICNRFIRNILSDDDVLNYLRINMKSWIGDSRNNDGKQLFRQITHEWNEKRKPFICIAGIHPISRKLVLVHRQYVGNITSSILFIANILDHGLQRWQSFKLQQIQRQQLSQSNRSLRQLQDLEYQQALQQEISQTEKDYQQEQDIISPPDIINDQQNDQNNQNDQTEKYQNRMKTAKEKINKLLKLNENVSKDKLIKVALRLPNGKRVQNIFCEDNNIESLFDFALCHELLIDNKDIDEFEIICNFPKLTFNPKDYNKTFKECGIEHSAIMHVSSLD